MTISGAETRSRILEAAWELVGERGSTNGVTVAEIAAAAGVSRQLVYFHFENRAGLLAAMARHHDVASGFAERVAACGELPPAKGLEELVRAWLGYIPEILPVARALEAAEISGEEGGAAWRDRMGSLWKVFRDAVGRVEKDGQLAEGWTVRTAADWVWARSHLDTWQHLVVECGWSSEDYEEQTVRSILAEVLSSPG
ncbi:Transcriptional regulator [Rubrobacter radiotolerans]|uniref:Transcriptional regulator n=1 Tax=Rubrobacter radiotolerans TaxID=42256 RepID=A0A023X1B4_RUBRA|nr:TetR/AcrR family transcriptional regulator [Rubrobacter radiotolerans]AHY45991.1 Transcriptional regulator [Rubrobacter radiotolerans]MDX5893403.1 TetR/AcrR family transcriptional regulator [Rubrobacter radiotolerans]SMC03661.1 transcriptional regulator, TetR family [Rubrobacter radiotolerans DSM 5868]